MKEMARKERLDSAKALFTVVADGKRLGLEAQSTLAQVVQAQALIVIAECLYEIEARGEPSDL